MAKNKTTTKAAAVAAAEPAAAKLSASKKTLDPTLASLFATSVGPAKPRPKEAYHQAPPKTAAASQGDDAAEDDEAGDEDDEDLSSIDEELPDDDDEEEGSDVEMAEAADDSSDEGARLPIHEAVAAAQGDKSQRKRKRKGDGDELEDKYMRKLEKEEERDEAKREAERNTKRQKKEDGASTDSEEEDVASGDEDEDAMEISDAESGFEIPKHESQLAQPKGDAAQPGGDTEVEKASRTCFLANVSTAAISDKPSKKALVRHLSSFLSDLPVHTPPHKFESLRFRSTPFSTYIPKKAAYAKKELMEETAHSTNAYVVYSTQQAAREAARRLNGTIVLGRHLRVDEVAHPAKTDHRRCIFVGGLAFVDDESMIQEAEAKRIGKDMGRKKEPGDVEEGLWRTFGKVGTVESVRVIRDPKTRVGKGIAYVQFTDENAVEAALLYNEKKFPPMLPRKLRVTRAKAFKRNAKPSASSTRPPTAAAKGGVYNPKVTPEERSLQGRAAKLLGKAGAAKVRKPAAFGRKDGDGSKPVGGAGGAFKTPEQFVFEGHRASEKQGKTGLKLGGKKGGSGKKPTSRSSKRGTAWKASGGRKA